MMPSSLAICRNTSATSCKGMFLDSLRYCLESSKVMHGYGRDLRSRMWSARVFGAICKMGALCGVCAFFHQAHHHMSLSSGRRRTFSPLCQLRHCDKHQFRINKADLSGGAVSLHCHGPENSAFTPHQKWPTGQYAHTAAWSCQLKRDLPRSSPPWSCKVDMPSPLLCVNFLHKTTNLPLRMLIRQQTFLQCATCIKLSLCQTMHR